MKENISLIKSKKEVLKYGVVIILFLALSGAIYLYNYLNQEAVINVPKKEVVQSAKETKEQQKTDEAKTLDVKWVVDIKGAVKSPGTYEVSNNIRVIDVIKIAGGLLKTADTSDINLSKKIKDQMVIIISTKQEIIKKREQQVPLINNDAKIEEPKADDDPSSEIPIIVSINMGTKEELMTLKGIGNVKATDIIAYREANGPFLELSDLLNVPGIKEATFNEILPFITL